MLTYCILFAGYCIIKHADFPVFKPLSIYTLWYAAILLSTVIVFGHPATKPFVFKLIQILISGYCVTIIAKYTNLDSLYKCWKILGLIVCAIVFYQFFQIYVLHQSVLPIRLLPLTHADIESCDNWVNPSERPVAFFTEPAMVVTFLTPVLFFAQQKKELLVATIVSIAIMLSGSTSGLVGLIILWGVPIVGQKMSKTTRFLLVLLFATAVVAFLSLSIFSDSVDKILYELSGESGNMNTRMLRGWGIYWVLDLRSQLLGISDYDITSFIYGHASEFTIQRGYEDYFYLNTIQRILIQTGLIGALIYIWMLIRLWISTDKAVKPYLIMVIVFMFFASNFFANGLFVLQYIVLLSYLKEYK